MILATDISQNFDLISKINLLTMIIVTFKGRMSSKKFPEETNEDKQLLLNLLIYASDHANPCKNSVLYFRWMANEMEEYY